MNAMNTMNANQLILNTCGVVYLRSTRLPNVVKIGRSNSDGLKRAGINRATIIRLCLSLNNYSMEQALIKGFNAKYEIYTGNEFYIIDSLIDAMALFDHIFTTTEATIYQKLSTLTSTSPTRLSIKQLLEEEGIVDEAEQSRLKKRKRSV